MSNTERLQHLNTSCRKNPDSWTGKPVKTRFIVDHKRKILYCSISKSGCTQMKGLLEFANTKNKQYLLNQNSVHSPKAHTRANLNIVYHYSSKFDAYKKILLVRNPLDRAVSAYRNLLVGRKNLGPERHVYTELQRRFPHASTKAGIMNNMTFELFVRAISNSSYSKAKYFNDRHFLPMFQSCDPCRIHYNYFLTLESFENDVTDVFNLLGLPSNTLEQYGALNTAKHQAQNSSHPASSCRKFQDLPQDVIKGFFERYQTDFDIFGYDTSNSCKFL